MAARFWVGGTATWDAVTTTNWSATSGGAGGASVPGAADTVTFDALSGGGVVTVGAAYNPSVTSITMGAFTGTLDFATNSSNPTMATFNCSGTGTRTLNMGSGTWTLTGNNATIWTTSTSTGLTLNPGTSTINCTYSGSVGTRTITTSTTTLGRIGNLNISAGTDTIFLSGSSAFAMTGDLNFTGFAGIWDISTSANSMNIGGSLTLAVGMTATGTASKTITFNSTTTRTITTNGVNFTANIVFNGVGGTWTLQDNFNCSNSVNTSITFTNGTFNSNAKTVTCGNFAAAAGTKTVTITNSIVNLASPLGWSMTSTGLTVNATGATLNFTGANAVFGGNNSTFGTINFTGGGAISGINTTVTCSTLNIVGTGVNDSFMFNTSGSMTVLGTATITGFSASNKLTVFSSVAGTTRSLSFRTAVLTNVNFTDINVSMHSTATSWALTEDLILGGTASTLFTINAGTFNANGFNISATAFNSSNSNTRSINMGTGIWTLTGTGTIWDTSTSTNLTLIKSKGTIKATNTGARTMTGGGLNFFKLVDLYSQVGLTLTSITFDGINFGYNRNQARNRTIATARTTNLSRTANRDMGTALSFDGVANKVVLPTAINTVLSKAAAEFSVEYTFKAPDVTSLTVLFSSTIDTNDRFAISFGSGTVRIGVYNGVSWNTGSGSMPVVANQWYTISLRAVAGIITQSMLNGIAKSRTGGSNPITATTAGVVIGAKTDSTSFSKHIGDQLRIWNRAITDTEMQNSYFSNAVPRTGLVGEWLFNETTGLVALDSSGNGNNGTITGATYTLDVPIKKRTTV